LNPGNQSTFSGLRKAKREKQILTEGIGFGKKNPRPLKKARPKPIEQIKKKRPSQINTLRRPLFLFLFLKGCLDFLFAGYFCL
jgi:hypothetical protein